MKKTILVSSCMLGIPCQYHGKSAKRCLTEAEIQKLNCILIPVCPEQLGGLATPRPPAEIEGGDGFDVLAGRARVINTTGQDVTENYIRGAEQVLKIAELTGASAMLVKRKSPSCSRSRIYDGTFQQKLIDGMGVTCALLTLHTSLELIDIDMLDAAHENGVPVIREAGQVSAKKKNELIQRTLNEVFQVYQTKDGWEAGQQKSTALIKNALLDEFGSGIETAIRHEFKQLLPALCTGVSDSDTIRFFREVFRKTLNIDLIDESRHCRICTYPEGFLDSYLDDDGICSACRAYRANKSILENRENLRNILMGKLAETPIPNQHNAVLAFSGGKDSVYALTRLRTYYKAKVLCVMDDLNQQTEQAMRNAEKAVRLTGADYYLLPPPKYEKEIRKNFIKAGESFCRLCLRSHFIRVYQVALEKKIPLVFFGFSPYQCLDCENAIEWSLGSIKEVATPFSQLDHKLIIARNKQRAFQGGFDRGFVSEEEKSLLDEWIDIFDQAPSNFAPLVVPFFIFDGYPDEETLIKTISRDVDWEPPEKLLLHRTNCKWLAPAGMFHNAVGKYHLNYKERATVLRFQDTLVSEEAAKRLFHEMNLDSESERMTKREFEEFLESTFSFHLDDIPAFVRIRLHLLFDKEGSSQ